MPIKDMALKEAVLDNVLSFIQSAKASLTRDNIIMNAISFYKSDQILKAKDKIYELADQRPPKRNKSPSHPDPLTADMDDIMRIFKMYDDGENKLPTFVAFGYMSMPPWAGVESFAAVMCSLRDEISALRMQGDEIKKSNEKDLKALDNVGSIIQDVSEVKMLIHDVPLRVVETLELKKKNAASNVPDASSVRMHGPAATASDPSQTNQFSYAATVRDGSPGNENPEALTKDDD